MATKTKATLPEIWRAWRKQILWVSKLIPGKVGRIIRQILAAIDGFIPEQPVYGSGIPSQGEQTRLCDIIIEL
jgi:hypothetical protein